MVECAGGRQAAAVPGCERDLLADDADARNFCSTCPFAAAGLGHANDKHRLRELQVLVEHTPPFGEGEHVFREGDDFNAIAAVRAGTVKSYVTDLDGREHVLGFFLPGEVIGLNAISRSTYPCSAVALETVSLCRLSFPRMATLATHLPGLQQELFRLLSEDIGKAHFLTGAFPAEERLAAFLVLLSRRTASRGHSATRFRLTMARTDIANYLRLAAETVSRLLRRFQQANIIRIDRREVELLDRHRLERLARNVLRN